MPKHFEPPEMENSRTSRKASVCISLQGVSTMRATVRIDSAAVSIMRHSTSVSGKAAWPTSKNSTRTVDAVVRSSLPASVLREYVGKARATAQPDANASDRSQTSCNQVDIITVLPRFGTPIGFKCLSPVKNEKPTNVKALLKIRNPAEFRPKVEL